MQDVIFCFDLDGTLLDENGKIHPADVDFLQRSMEYPFIVATGRPFASVKRIFGRHGLFVNQKIPVPLILQNGTLLYLPYEQWLSYMPFAAGDQADIIKLARGFPTITFLLLAEKEMFMMNRTPEGDLSNRIYDLSPSPLTSAGEMVPFSKVMSISNDKAALEVFKHESMKIPAERSISIGTMYELNPAGVDKSTGLLRVLQAMQITKSRILVAGDGGNDLPLFDIADRTFVPRSAPEIIRSRANRIIDRPKTGIIGVLLEDYRSSGREN